MLAETPPPELEPPRLRARRTPCSLCYSRFKFILEEESSMAHAPQFLKLVNEAKKKVKETNVGDVKRRIEAGEKFLLVDVGEGPPSRRGASGQRHYRARHRAMRPGY